MYIFIGTIVNTHGIKGEVRIISDFEYKDLVFKKGFDLYIGENKIAQKINTYRIHKIFDMVTFDKMNDINDVLKYKGENVYIKREDINIDYYISDLIGFDVYGNNDKYIGKVDNIIKNKKYDILVVGKSLIPNIDNFVKKVDINKYKIFIEDIEGLINEN